MVVVSELSQSAGGDQTYTTAGLNMMVGGLHPYYTYQCKVAAETSVGTGDNSTLIAHLPEDGKCNSVALAFNSAIWHTLLSCFVCLVPSSPPQRVRGEATGPRTIRVSWDLPPEEDRNGLIRGNTINVTEVETGQTLTQNTGTSELEISTLHPYYHYNCAVAAITVGTGPYSAAITVQTEEDGIQFNSLV